MISVIIPVYNVEKYINKCIESVLSQTFTDFEVILINDGSTDNSGIICQQWEKKDSRIRYIQKKNEGLGITRNLGVAIAKFDYITFLDSDDWWDVHYLEKMMCPILENKVDVVCCDIHYWELLEDGCTKDNVSELRIKPNEVVCVSEDKELINTARTFMWGKIYRKSLFIGINQPAHAYEDVPVTPLLIAKAATVYRVPFPLYYYYRNRGGSLANSSNTLADMEKSIIELIENFKRENLYEHYEKQLKKLVYSQVRFIIRKSRALLRETMESAAFYSSVLKMENYQSIDMSDNFYVVGNDNLGNVVNLLAIDETQVKYIDLNNTEDVLKQGFLFIDLADICEHDVYKIKKFLHICSFKLIVLIYVETLEHWQNELIEFMKEKKHNKKICIKIEKSIKNLNEKQVWDLADDIFYAI